MMDIDTKKAAEQLGEIYRVKAEREANRAALTDLVVNCVREFVVTIPKEERNKSAAAVLAAYLKSDPSERARIANTHDLHCQTLEAMGLCATRHNVFLYNRALQPEIQRLVITEPETRTRTKKGDKKPLKAWDEYTSTSVTIPEITGSDMVSTAKPKGKGGKKANGVKKS